MAEGPSQGVPWYMFEEKWMRLRGKEMCESEVAGRDVLEPDGDCRSACLLAAMYTAAIKTPLDQALVLPVSLMSLNTRLSE